MVEIPGFHAQEITVATMTLLLDHVRAIPALTGDMRPLPATVPEPVVDLAGERASFDPAEMVQVPAGFEPSEY